MRISKRLCFDLEKFEAIYSSYNRRELIDPDPLVFLYNYPNPADREIVGLISSSLAYGRVATILKSIGKILAVTGSSPACYLKNSTLKSMLTDFAGFKHRFTSGEDMAIMLDGVRNAIDTYGSLEGCFNSSFKCENGCDFLSAQHAFVSKLCSGFSSGTNYLLPSPIKGSACKRLNLYLRWMVRCDDVDPGGWKKIPPSMLIIPLDTHMGNICRHLGMTSRKNSDLKTALEITSAFATLNPADPVKYDFALTRFGIRNDMDIEELLS